MLFVGFYSSKVSMLMVFLSFLYFLQRDWESFTDVALLAYQCASGPDELVKTLVHLLQTSLNLVHDLLGEPKRRTKKANGSLDRVKPLPGDVVDAIESACAVANIFLVSWPELTSEHLGAIDS
jgi:hypothetical protein